MIDNHIISQEEQNNEKLMPTNTQNTGLKMELNLSIEDLRNLAILKYGSVGAFARKMGITQPLGTRLLNGSYIPLRAKSIQKIADCLEVSPVMITRIYDGLKEKKKQAVMKE